MSLLEELVGKEAAAKRRNEEKKRKRNDTAILCEIMKSKEEAIKRGKEVKKVIEKCRDKIYMLLGEIEELNICSRDVWDLETYNVIEEIIKMNEPQLHLKRNIRVKARDSKTRNDLIDQGFSVTCIKDKVECLDSDEYDPSSCTCTGETKKTWNITWDSLFFNREKTA